jgi:UDP-GlcNAc:undecaprenyl-phosphate GlcNAc-1-phosphate transferase
MVLGFLLSALAIKLDFHVRPERQIVTWMIPVVVLGFPIFDTTLVVFTRLRERRSPMKGGKDHTSHRLCQLGLSQRAAVVILYAICAALGYAAIELSQSKINEGLRLGFSLGVIAAGAFIYLEYVYIRSRQKADDFRHRP